MRGVVSDARIRFQWWPGQGSGAWKHRGTKIGRRPGCTADSLLSIFRLAFYEFFTTSSYFVFVWLPPEGVAGL